MANECPIKQRRLESIGNYKLMRHRIGEGSFSKVELALHTIIGQKVALKIQNISLMDDPYVRKHHQREASIMSRLSHPNVVKLHEICSYGDIYCLAMDYYSGGNLVDFVHERGTEEGGLEEYQAKMFYRQILEGMDHIHSRGIIHRDIKLDNIFLTENFSNAVIGDFGLSNFWTGSVLRTRCGSAEYAAPELLDKQQNYTKAIDVWSSGVVLFAMLTAQLPFNAEEDSHKVKNLYRQIKLGLTDVQFKMLQSSSVSVEAKMILSEILKPNVSDRLGISQLKDHHWFADLEALPSRAHDLGAEQQMEVAKEVQKRLKLTSWSPKQILAYVMSGKGKFGKTAGCFSLIAQDFLTKKESDFVGTVVKPKFLHPDNPRSSSPLIRTFQNPREMRPLPSSTAKPVEAKLPTITPITASMGQHSHAKQMAFGGPAIFTKPLTEKTLAGASLPTPTQGADQGQAGPSKSSYWETSQGKAAVFALAKLKADTGESESDNRGTGQAIVSSPPAKKAMTVTPFFKPEKMKLWRRSTKPAAGGHVRLKRVDGGGQPGENEDIGDTSARKPLATLDQNSRAK